MIRSNTWWFWFDKRDQRWRKLHVAASRGRGSWVRVRATAPIGFWCCDGWATVAMMACG